MLNINNRYKAFAAHLAISLILLGVLLSIIFFYWYPYDFIKAGGAEGLKILTGVDMVLGPLLTLIVFNPNKRKKLLKLDLSLIALAQLSCMSAGLWLIYNERPLVQLLADDGVHILAKADFATFDKDPEKIDLPGRYPKFAALDFPMDREQLGVMKFAGDFMGEPYNLDPKRYIAPNQLNVEDMQQRVDFILAGLDEPTKAFMHSLPKKASCTWLPVISIHFNGAGCLDSRLGLQKLVSQ